MEFESSLAIVETLFEEFFNPYTSNFRKHEIEVQLSVIKEVPHKGNLCLHFIKHTSSQHVIMFTLQILEFMVNQGQWPLMETEIQDELKAVLPLTLITKSNIPNFLKSKYAKIIVNIAKVDRPGTNSNFFDTLTSVIITLLKSSDSKQLVGLMLFRAMCEEFLGLNVKLQSLSCKKEVKKLQEDYIPRVLYILTDILENISSKSKHTATATPPPSPTHNNSAIEGQMSNHNYSADYHPDAKYVVQESLAIISLLFASIPMEQVPLISIRAVFNFTKCSIYSQDDDDLCVSAISTINELFYRKSCPSGTEPLFKAIYVLVVELLRNMTTSVTYRCENTDELFVDKICELLVLLVEQHFCRFEADPSFSSLEFLSLFFQYTMNLSNSSHFLRCLSVWSTFFKRVKPYASVKYQQVCLGLGSALINKIQFSSNHAQLVDLETINVDDNNTEWQYFLNSSVEIISQAAQLAPLEILNQILNSWNLCSAQYQELEKYSETWFNNSSNIETDKLTYILRDFSTLTFTLASLADNFCHTENPDINGVATPIICLFMENTIKSASSYKKIKSYLLRFNDPKLMHSFIDLQSELLSVLKTWLSWMEVRSQLNSNVDIFLNLLLPVLHDGDKVPLQISSAAAQLFLELSRRPNYLCPLRNRAVADFIIKVPKLKFSSLDIANSITSAICEILLKPLKSLNQQTLQSYKRLIDGFFKEFTADFMDLTLKSTEIKVRDTVHGILPALTHVIEYSRCYPLASKKELASSIEPILTHSMALFPTYVKYSQVHDLFPQFFNSILRNLQSQIGPDFTKNAMNIFFQVAVWEQQSNNLAGVKQLLDIFIVVVKESTTNKNFFSDILQICMESIYPLLTSQAMENPDVFVSFLELLHSILKYHWLYFYNSQVLMGFSPGCNEDEVGPDVPKRPEQLLAILKVFGEALLMDDINIFRQSLASLQDLNCSKKLYHKGLFQTNLLPELLRVLLQTFVYKKQSLAKEDIMQAVYDMSEVDFDGFVYKFLPLFLENADDLNGKFRDMLLCHFQNNTDRDVPSFMQNLQNFAADFEQVVMYARSHSS